MPWIFKTQSQQEKLTTALLTIQKEERMAMDRYLKTAKNTDGTHDLAAAVLCEAHEAASAVERYINRNRHEERAR